MRETQKFPTTEDLNGAAIALTRLQDTYLLDTGAMARGDLNGHSGSAKLNGKIMQLHLKLNQKKIVAFYGYVT